MNVTTISAFRKNTKKYVDEMVKRKDILVIARSGAQSLVMMPLERYNDMDTTEYLMSSPANTKRLLESLHELRQGNGRQHELAQNEQA